jgi:hypothetical protein
MHTFQISSHRLQFRMSSTKQTQISWMVASSIVSVLRGANCAPRVGCILFSGSARELAGGILLVGTVIESLYLSLAAPEQNILFIFSFAGDPPSGSFGYIGAVPGLEILKKRRSGKIFFKIFPERPFSTII